MMRFFSILAVAFLAGCLPFGTLGGDNGNNGENGGNGTNGAAGGNVTGTLVFYQGGSGAVEACTRDVVLDNAGHEGVVSIVQRNGETEATVALDQDGEDFAITTNLTTLDAPDMGADPVLAIANANLQEWLSFTGCNPGDGEVILANGSETAATLTSAALTVSEYVGPAPDTLSPCPVTTVAGECVGAEGRANVDLVMDYDDASMDGTVINVTLSANMPLFYAEESP
jgi:hypothetical protein